MTVLATRLAKFLREHLPHERNASLIRWPPTPIVSHFCSLHSRAAEQRPSDLAVEDIDPKLVLEFLDRCSGKPRKQRAHPQHPPRRNSNILPLPQIPSRPPASNKRCASVRCR